MHLFFLILRSLNFLQACTSEALLPISSHLQRNFPVPLFGGSDSFSLHRRNPRVSHSYYSSLYYCRVFSRPSLSYHVSICTSIVLLLSLHESGLSLFRPFLIP